MKTILGIILSLCIVQKNIADEFLRDKRNIGLFNLVIFNNALCTSQDATAPLGVCYTSDECVRMGGVVSGNCAFAFGVCCLSIVSTCGGTVTGNNTYFRNPNYPRQHAPIDLENCVYTIRTNPNICQIRLDILDLVTTTSPNGMCGDGSTDKIVISNPNGSNPPGPGGFCGRDFTGQHMYIETLGGDPSIQFQFGQASTFTRRWNIRVTQIECNNPSRAPPGCVQYYTGTTGRIMSYNFNNNLLTSGLSYMSCIRRELGQCTITYSAPGDNDFLLMATIAIKSQDSSIAIDCAIASVQISGTGAPIDSFCGGKFNAESMQEVSGSITSMTIPFSINTVTSNAASTSKGYNLLYVQNPC